MSHPNMSRNDKALRTSGIWTQHVLHFSFWYRNNLSIISFVWSNQFFFKMVSKTGYERQREYYANRLSIVGNNGQAIKLSKLRFSVKTARSTRWTWRPDAWLITPILMMNKSIVNTPIQIVTLKDILYFVIPGHLTKND